MPARRDGPTDDGRAGRRSKLLGARGLEVAGITQPITNLDKVLIPAAGSGTGITKRDIIRYYAT